MTGQPEIDSQDITDGTGQPEQLSWEKSGRKVSEGMTGPPNITAKHDYKKKNCGQNFE
jgi:hypothetical protein